MLPLSLDYPCLIVDYNDFYFFNLCCFNATFSNISAISWQPVLVVEEAEYPERTTDQGQATGKLESSAPFNL
jgi:hypothetical protein